uniref:Very long-chain specific acyl-CoA dehydrogenase, mitochondrial (Trinotate prediction) n=1 Tax=Henneguya salminicola TaxID=69463 RepID=A0A6G3MGQ5_HENSL
MIYKFALLKRGIKSGLRSISTPNIISLFKENLALFRLTNLVTQYPKVQRNSELNEVIEKKEILDSFLKNNIKPLQYDRAEEVDHDFFKDLLKMGLFSAPKELGGLGFNASQSSLLLECLPKYDLAVAVMFGVQQTIGSNAILKYGSTFLKSTYIPKLSCGEMIGCFCLTESEAGSDASSIKTFAIYDGSNDSWVLNGTKIWFT